MVLQWRFLDALKFKSFAFVFLSLFIVQFASAKESFEKKKIQLGSKTLVVEVAQTPAQFEQGLMGRESLEKDSGMLFIFPNEQTRFFWMKNTLIDLSIAFFNKKGELINIQEMKSGKGVSDHDLPSYASEKPAMYALEMESGWFARNKIKAGVKMKILKSN
ncbi:hypothetical protein BDW_00260 [Bdellovibrio bacteriovorus W]|nr:hypothetical protein BDW_00260 [Bdellovibrio bacteriovorus W]